MSDQTRTVARQAAKETNGAKPKPEVADKISDDFIAMLQSSQSELMTAMANLSTARAASQFVQRSMAAAYQLKEGDEINPETGEITRKPKEEVKAT